MSGRKRLIFFAIAFSLVGIATGILLGGNLLPSQASSHQYAEKPISIKTETIVIEHSHDGLPMHKHVIKTTITVIETTPHGDFHDFTPTTASDIPTSTTSVDTRNAANSTQNTADNTRTTVNTTQTTPPPTKGTYEVWLDYNLVMPESITVPVGATVTWTNKDFNQEHTVTFDNGLLNRRLVPRTSFNYTFTEAGTFTYHCDPHPNLVGEVIVK